MLLAIPHTITLTELLPLKEFPSVLNANLTLCFQNNEYLPRGEFECSSSFDCLIEGLIRDYSELFHLPFVDVR